MNPEKSSCDGNGIINRYSLVWGEQVGEEYSVLLFDNVKGNV